MADQDKPASNPIQKLQRDVEFWRKGVEDAQNEKNQIAAQLVQKSSELVAANDKLAAVVRTLEEIIEDRETALRLLRTLARHVAGRDGMLKLSTTFCEVCQDPRTCVLREVNDFIGNPVEVNASVAF